MLTCEDEFQAKMMREKIYHHHINSGNQIEWYAKVSYIGRKRTLSEMDLIVVEKNSKNIIGYEFKFLQKKKLPDNYQQIYSGLGQALLYFWHGIEQNILVIGISKKVSTVIMKKTIQLISAIDNLNNAMEYRCLGLIVYSEEEDKIIRLLPPKGKFPVYKLKEMQGDKENILVGNVGWNRSFLDRYGLTLFHK